MIWLLFIFTACSQPKNVDPHFSGEAMTMPYHVHVAHPLTQADRIAIQEIIDTTFSHANVTYNHWNPTSELSKFNKLKSFEALLISHPLTDLFKLSARLHQLSRGRFDPSLRPLIQALKTDEPCDKAATGWDMVGLNDSIATKKHDTISLDFDAISKGYTIDLMMERLNRAGYPNVFIEWAGEIKASGQPEPNRAWSVAIRHPNSPYIDDAIEKLALNNQAIATSGDYIQVYEYDNQEVSHIVDGQSKTPRPLVNTSVTVTAKSCALADGLATCAMLIDDHEELKAWIDTVQEHYPETQFWVINRLQ